MTFPPQGAHWPHFADASSDGTNFGQSYASPGSASHGPPSIDFGASQAFFDGIHGSGPTSSYGSAQHSPTHHYGSAQHSPTHHYGNAQHSPTHDYGPGSHTGPTSPGSAISGLDPISKLGFTSNRPSRQSQYDQNGYIANQYFPQANGHQYQQQYVQSPAPQMHPQHYPQYSNVQHAHVQHTQHQHAGPSSNATFSPPPASHPHGQDFQHHATSIQQQRDDAAHRTAEVERRNRLREEEKTRRMLQIQKQVQDGMDAVRFEQDDSAHRTAEVERRNKLRGEEKEKRRLAIQKQVEDGIKVIQQEKQRERQRVEADRASCRKWIADLSKSSSSDSTLATSDIVDLFAALGRQLRSFWEESRPNATAQAHRDEVIADVQRAINRKFTGQGLKVAAFGSSVTGLLTESSDLDLVLLDPTRPCGVGTPSELCRKPNFFVRHTNGMPEWYTIRQIANAIRTSNKFEEIVPISNANVPIVKMVHRKHRIPADLNINERFGLFNSQLIQAYANLQPQIVRPLIFFLKHWYSRRDLNDPAGKRGSMTFSSYTIALMALQVLQVEGILPNLQSPSLLKSLNIQPTFLYSRFKRPKRGKNARANPVDETSPPQQYNVTFATGPKDMESYKARALQLSADDSLALGSSTSASSTDRLLGRMLVSFVQFYAQLDRRRQVVSVVNGAPLQRNPGSSPRHVLFDSASEDDGSELNGTVIETSPELVSGDATARAALREEQKDIWAGEELVVQDPFIIDRNTSRNINSASVERWQSTMEDAAALLGAGKQVANAQARKVHLKGVPLILDLCIPDDLRRELNSVDNSASASGRVGPNGKSTEPWKQEEEAAALERKIAREAAEILRRQKKQQARRAKSSEALRLREEAAMVEDMIDGMKAGRVTGLASGDLPGLWRLRPEKDANAPKEPASVPFTFSVPRPSDSTPAASTLKTATTNGNGDASKQLEVQDATISPTVSSKTGSSSESEDIDLVALRLEQAARVA